MTTKDELLKMLVDIHTEVKFLVSRLARTEKEVAGIVDALDKVEHLEDTRDVCPKVHICVTNLLNKMEWNDTFLKTTTRKTDYVDKRSFLFWYLVRVKGFTPSVVGRHFMKDHTVILHNINKIHNMVETKDPVIMDFFKKATETGLIKNMDGARKGL